MLGRDHIIFATTVAVVLDSELRITGQPLLPTLQSPTPATFVLLATKIIFYVAVGLGSLLPDIDDAHSLVGQWCGLLSLGIQRTFKHRRFFHSLLGLLPWALLSLGLYGLSGHLLALRGQAIPAAVALDCQRAFVGLLFGSLMHLVADGLTVEGVPLFWPYPARFGFPPNPHWRIRSGGFGERIIIYGLVGLVGLGYWTSVLTFF